MVFQVYRDLKDIKVIFFYLIFFWLNYVYIIHLGDVGEPGIGGGVSAPGRKGATGIYFTVKQEKRK